MSDSTAPGGGAPSDEEKPAVRDEPMPDEDTPGDPESDAPMSDSTEGGLEGGDPGVEE
ncbi:hypothetical protein GCM10017608_15120 [Agromyces luteolus]|uniref:Uncharacterized protein n=1 Tax=Agromyces luteolus TaxID=88373 RepID=A0A7C9HIJ3_9MICO|nr:hypothetical protein [Agromyces luteolus]MUN07803.1 hypothetical protein [Agromyces luteolus]GLK27578.1 hypothetical protein GCM10017608_15120 [Agromyces luteolus]